MKQHLATFGELNPLSNFHPSPFMMYDQEYHCSEQYIQVAKAKYFNDIDTYDKLHNTKTDLECKIIAKQTKNFNGKKWEQVAKDICLTSLTRAKCGIRSTLCWKILNISGSIELFAL